MKRLGALAFCVLCIFLVGCGSDTPSAADDAALRKRLGNGPPTMPGAGKQMPKGARQDEKMKQLQGQGAPAGGGN